MKHNLYDLDFLVRCAVLNEHGQTEVMPSAGRGAATTRLHRAGLLTKAGRSGGYYLSHEGEETIKDLLFVLNDRKAEVV